ncbi:signal peptidase I [Nocardioides sp.]|uniref:signal peptidase I n=1 Tax=Nocardioides sp. TaxID=35761 RepID=UPI0035659244
MTPPEAGSPADSDGPASRLRRLLPSNREGKSADESGSGADLGSTDQEQPKDSAGKVLKETVLLLGFAIVLALVVKTFFIQSFYIPSESMEPGLVVNDRILVQKPSYWNGEPQRGDVIVFDDPGGWLSGLQNPQPTSLLTRGLSKIGLYPTGGHLVKRVIGVEGDVIVCCDKDGWLTVNGQPVDERGYIADQNPKNKPNKKICAGPMVASCNWTAGPVPKDSLFVMGDNRSNSADSSVHICRKRTDCAPTEGYVPIDLVVGKVFALAWPPGRMTLIGRADAFEDVPEPSPQTSD